jgi:hypothetical protein
MPIYTVCSTDPEHYNEIIVNLPYANSQKIVEISILSICTLFNLELINASDYITILVGGLQYKINGVSLSRLMLDMLPSFLTNLLNKAGLTSFKVELGLNNILIFSSTFPFTIVDMSYNFKLATGFYYSKGLPATATANPDEQTYELSPSSVAFTASTPILYLLSNTGGNCYRMSITEQNVQNGVIGMIIHNSFIPGMPCIFQQGDIVSQCLSSDLSFIRLSLVDSNFVSVKLLNPLFCTLSVQDVADSTY